VIGFVEDNNHREPRTDSWLSTNDNMQRGLTASEKACEINDRLVAADGEAIGEGRLPHGGRPCGRLTFRIRQHNRDRFTDRTPKVLLPFTLESCATPRERTNCSNGYVKETLRS
jgi:hypothetical protein